MDREANVGGILSQTFETLGAAAKAVALYIIVLGVFSGIGGFLGLVMANGDFFSASWMDGEWQVAPDYADGAGAAFIGLYSIASVVLYVVASYLLLRQYLIGVGRPIAPGSRFWVFLLMSILALIGMTIGFMLLIVPGLILLCRWAAANGMAISRGAGITESLSESWEATSGRGLSIFLAGLVLVIALGVLSSMVAAPIGAILMQPGMTEFGNLSLTAGLLVAVQSFTETLSNAVMLALSIAVFHLVSPSDEGMAEVFE